jgi:hypothetical protein
MVAGESLWRMSRPAKGGLFRQNFIFVGAGGVALEPLEKSNIPEGHGYDDFPVHGIWLRCEISLGSESLVSNENVRSADKLTMGTMLQNRSAPTGQNRRPSETVWPTA